MYVVRGTGTGSYSAPSMGVEIGKGVDYTVIEDEEQADYVVENTNQPTSAFGPDVHGDILEGRANEAAAEIRDGDHDAVLDVLLFAEQEIYGGRVTVIDAITARLGDLEGKRAAESEDTARPSAAAAFEFAE